jgi:hypothetical protein
MSAARKKQPRRRGRPPTGAAKTAAQRMRLMRQRRKAAGFRSVRAWQPRKLVAVPYSSHRLLEARSLAMHAVIARKIERDPKLLDVARRNLQRWRARWDAAPPAWFQEWGALLQQPWPRVAALIAEPSEEAARLRQSSPFAGVLTKSERDRIYEAFRA